LQAHRTCASQQAHLGRVAVHLQGVSLLLILQSRFRQRLPQESQRKQEDVHPRLRLLRSEYDPAAVAMVIVDARRLRRSVAL